MRSAAAATALGLTLSLVGLSSCSTPDDPVLTGPPEPAATPVFASDEEAIAAAEEVYGRYLDVSNKVGHGGWKDASSFELVARDGALDDQVKSAAEFAALGYIQIGDTTFDSLQLQQWRTRALTSVSVYLCIDVSQVDVVDADGESVVSASRPLRQPREVEVDNADGEFKVVRSEAWSGDSFC